MLALRQLKRVPKNHKIFIEIPESIKENQLIEVILLCKENVPTAANNEDKLLQLKNGLHDPLFLEDLAAISSDFASIDNEVW